MVKEKFKQNISIKSYLRIKNQTKTKAKVFLNFFTKGYYEKEGKSCEKRK